MIDIFIDNLNYNLSMNLFLLIIFL